MGISTEFRQQTEIPFRLSALKVVTEVNLLVAWIFAVGVVLEGSVSIHNVVAPVATDNERVTDYTPLGFVEKGHNLTKK